MIGFSLHIEPPSYARPIPVQTKVHFKNLQFLAVTYDMEVLICAFDVI